jgi:hypothetical protein
MSKEISKPENNPYLAYGIAATAKPFAGDLLKFQKGEYRAGIDDKEIPHGTKCVALMGTLAVGWQCWKGNRPCAQEMGLVADNFQPPMRKALGDTDESHWEKDEQGQPKDPWQYTNLLVLVGLEDNALYTFTTTSKGGRGAAGELGKDYGKQMRQRPDQYPVVVLGVSSYLHKNKAYGRIKNPTFKIVDWVPKKPFDDLLDASGRDDDGDDGSNGAVVELGKSVAAAEIAIAPPPSEPAKPDNKKTQEATRF